MIGDQTSTRGFHEQLHPPSPQHCRDPSTLCADLHLPPSSVLPLAEAAPGLGLLCARRHGTRSRCGRPDGCRQDGRLCAPQVADPEPSFEAITRGANAVAGARPAWPPGEDLDFVAVGEGRQGIRTGIVRQRPAGRAVFRTSHVDPPADGENGAAGAGGRGPAKRLRKRHRASLMCGLNGRQTARRPLSARRSRAERAGGRGSPRSPWTLNQRTVLLTTPSVKFPSVTVGASITPFADSRLVPSAGVRYAFSRARSEPRSATRAGAPRFPRTCARRGLRKENVS